ncbi:MAG: DinB family protein [Chloroflexi bacterium]|nr:DinB family protein [Chloroflexota bacterium]
MTLMTPIRFIRSLKKTPVILDYVLRDVNHETARIVTDGPDGWNTLQIMCHLRDFEKMFFERVRLMVEKERPLLPRYDSHQMVIDNDYANSGYRAALQEFAEIRRQHVAYLEALPPEAWWRSGVHPEHGVITVMEQAMQVALHDVDHIAQIIHMIQQQIPAG